MSEEINHTRRRFFGIAAIAVAAAEFGLPAIADAAETKASASTLPGVNAGTHTSFGALKQINAGVLNVGYAEAGPANGPVVLLLHGWPYDIYSFVDVAPLLAGAGYRVIIPYLRGYGTTTFLSKDTPRNGQQAALAADMIDLLDALKIDKAVIAGYDGGRRREDIGPAFGRVLGGFVVGAGGYHRGGQKPTQARWPRRAGLAGGYRFFSPPGGGVFANKKTRHDFAKLIWHTASPQWAFDDATYDRSAAAFDNPDHVEIVIHNYRWRLGLVEGEAKFDAYEKKLATGPVISIPTITMEGDANGAPHPEPSAYRGKFSGKYEHRTITGGIGHNLPQEAPQAFAQAVIDVDRF